MSKINKILQELGISKVRLAKYLGVSRQMLYNYLACETLEEWPSEKATRLMQLLEVKSEEELNELTIDGDYIIKIDNKLNEGVKIALSSNSLVDLKGFNRKEVELLTDITNLLKDQLKDDKTKYTYNSFVYLYHFLQCMDSNKDLKYYLCFISKLFGFTKPKEFLFNEDQQIIFEGLMYKAYTLYTNTVANNGGASRSKLEKEHEKMVKDIEAKNEEKLSRTQELNAIKMQALKELGYTEINQENAKEVFDKIAEIQTRRN